MNGIRSVSKDKHFVSCYDRWHNYSIVLISMNFFFFFFINISVGFRLFVIHRRRQRDIFLSRPCIRPSSPSALFSVRNHISVLICHIRSILCTNDMYHVLSISYKLKPTLKHLSYGPCFSKGIYNAKPISAILYDDLHISQTLLYLTTSHYRP